MSRNDLTGKHDSSIRVVWDATDGAPRGEWEVWFRDVDLSSDDWEGTFTAAKAALEYSEGDRVELDGKTYRSTEDNNASTPFTR